MSAPRFYCSLALAAGDRLALPQAVFHHAIRVRRLRAGDGLVLFAGDATESLARLVAVDRHAAAVEILRVSTINRESPLAVTLLQGISAGDRMEYTLQKAVELGVVAIVPVMAERSVVRLAGERADKRIARWQQVVISACEQCGRNTIPAVLPVVPLRDALSVAPAAPSPVATSPDVSSSLVSSPAVSSPVASERYVLSVADGERLRDVIAPSGPVMLLAGPEGGLTDDEESAAVKAGFKRLSLGPRVLRTETAAIVALAAMQAIWGDS